MSGIEALKQILKIMNFGINFLSPPPWFCKIRQNHLTNSILDLKGNLALADWLQNLLGWITAPLVDIFKKFIYCYEGNSKYSDVRLRIIKTPFI